MKKISDLLRYKEILPFDSEIFGVYQPMIGWRSRRIRERIDRGFRVDRFKAARSLYERLNPQFEMKVDERGRLQSITGLRPAAAQPALRGATGSFLIDALARELPADAGDDEALWNRLVDKKRIDGLLTQEVVPKLMEWHRSPSSTRPSTPAPESAEREHEIGLQLQRESRVAGYLLHLKQHKQYGLMRELFLKPERRLGLLSKLLSFKD